VAVAVLADSAVIAATVSDHLIVAGKRNICVPFSNGTQRMLKGGLTRPNYIRLIPAIRVYKDRVTIYFRIMNIFIERFLCRQRRS